MAVQTEFIELTEEKIEEKNRYFFALIFVAGFFGAFTFCLRGGVFCNAQTGNLLLASVSLVTGDMPGFWSYFWSLLAYFIGVMLATLFGILLKKRMALWHMILILVEIAAVLALGLLPDAAPVRISQITINTMAAMQFTTFHKVRGEPMASTFCTNHLREAASALTRWAMLPKEKRQRYRFLQHIAMILFFCLGVAVSTLLGTVFGGKSIWFAALPLGYVLLSLLFSQKRVKKARNVSRA